MIYIGRRQTIKLVARGDKTYYIKSFFQDFSEKSPKQKTSTVTHIFYSIIRSPRKYLCKNMFFVVPVTFSDMFILYIDVFLAFIRLT